MQFKIQHVSSHVKRLAVVGVLLVVNACTSEATNPPSQDAYSARTRGAPTTFVSNYPTSRQTLTRSPAQPDFHVAPTSAPPPSNASSFMTGAPANESASVNIYH